MCLDDQRERMTQKDNFIYFYFILIYTMFNDSFSPRRPKRNINDPFGIPAFLQSKKVDAKHQSFRVWGECQFKFLYNSNIRRICLKKEVLVIAVILFSLISLGLTFSPANFHKNYFGNPSF